MEVVVEVEVKWEEKVEGEGNAAEEMDVLAVVVSVSGSLVPRGSVSASPPDDDMDDVDDVVS